MQCKKNEHTKKCKIQINSKIIFIVIVRSRCWKCQVNMQVQMGRYVRLVSCQGKFMSDESSCPMKVHV